MTESAVIDLRGSKVHVQRFGRGEPLLFLHGLQGMSENEPGLLELSERYEIIAPDHPGFGRSDVSDNVDDVKDLAIFYLDLLDALKLDAVHVVGQCLGGWIAMEMAIYASHRFKSLTLVNSAGLRLKGVPRGDMFVCSEGELLKLLFAGEGAKAWLETWRSSPDREDIYERNRAAAAKFSWSPRLCNPKLDRWLHRVKVPTHVVWSEGNQVIPLAYGEALRDMIPGASLSKVGNAAHLVNLDQPKAFAREISQFVGRTAS